MRFVIGVDGGGTSTRCACLNMDGAILAIREAGPSNYLRVGLPTALEHIRDAVHEAVEVAHVSLPARVACICLAGLGRLHDQRTVIPQLESLALADQLVAHTDAEAALAGAHGLQEGVVLIAGTGAIAYGRNAQGERVRADGWGPLLGDEGSAHWIGVQVLRAVMRARDGRGEPTSLTPAVLAHFGLDAEEDLVTRLPAAHTSAEAIAPLAPICTAVADGGDAVARAILQDAGARLAQSACAAVLNLGLPGPVRIAVTGGAMRSKHLRDAVERSVARQCGAARIIEPIFPAVVGAGLMALQAAGIDIDQALLGRVTESLPTPGA